MIAAVLALFLLIGVLACGCAGTDNALKNGNGLDSFNPADELVQDANEDTVPNLILIFKYGRQELVEKDVIVQMILGRKQTDEEIK